MKYFKNYKNLKVLVTGSSKGIGFEIAKSFLNENAFVCINSRSENNLKLAANA